MSRYIAIIEYDETEEVFGAFFPDAPGAVAMASSEDEAVALATDALSEWATDMAMGGMTIPEPRSYAQLLRSGEYPQLGKGGIIATIPMVFETGRPARANFSLDAGLLKAIDDEANHLGITRSAFLASAARAKIRSAA
jgi:predicted RNase H-like HicB family nuclease